MAKFYAVKRGRKPGIYLTWAECQQQVIGFSNARYKSFPTEKAAQAWLDAKQVTPSQSNKSSSISVAFDKTRLHYKWQLWTDGGSRNHGNHLGGHVRATDLAAWAFYLTDGTEDIKQAHAVQGATNNAMEIMALLQALQLLHRRQEQHSPILATLDSRYVLDVITKGWLKTWQRNGWRTQRNQPVANQSLWAQVAALLPEFSALDFQWTKGHATNAGNNLVDELLNQAMDTLAKKVNG